MKKIIFAISIITLAYAAPALQKDIELQQKDGSTFSAKLNGDEWLNWIEDTERHIIKYSNKSKNFEYAALKEIDGELDLAPSGVEVGSALGTLSADQSKIDKQTLLELWKQKKEKSLEVYPSK